MSDVRLPQHGRDHRVGGSDPIPGMGSGGGIQFDTYPQAGGWLYVNTDGTGSPPSGYGIRIQDSSATGILLEQTGSGIVNILADSGDLNINTGSGALSVTSNGGAVVVGNEGDGSAIFESHATGGLGLEIANRDNGNMYLTSNGNGDITLRCQGDGWINLEIDGAGSFTLTGLPIVNPGGSDILWNNGGVLNIT